jgi:hypothetical protein
MDICRMGSGRDKSCVHRGVKEKSGTRYASQPKMYTPEKIKSVFPLLLFQRGVWWLDAKMNISTKILDESRNSVRLLSLDTGTGYSIFFVYRRSWKHTSWVTSRGYSIQLCVFNVLGRASEFVCCI